MTYQNCPTVRYNEGTNWPIGAGHPCIGCAEPDFWDIPTYTPIKLQDYLPPVTYPEAGVSEGKITHEGAAVTGGAVGVIVGASLAFGYSLMTNRAKGVMPEVDHTEPTDEDHKLPHE